VTGPPLPPPPRARTASRRRLPAPRDHPVAPSHPRHHATITPWPPP